MNLLNFTIIKLLFFLVAGIIFGYYSPINISILCAITLIFILVLLTILIYTKKNNKQNIWFGVISYLLILIVGQLCISFHTESNHLNHYSHQISSKEEHQLQIHIFKKLKASKYQRKFIGKIVQFNNSKSSGIVLVNVDSTQQITIDDYLYTSAHLLKINNALNPHQFDYGEYMKKKQVLHQVYLNKKNSIHLQNKTTIYGASESIRNKINNSFLKHNISNENLSVINALLLGQKQLISKDTYKQFTQSGTIHILAISGLHIGLLMMLLGWTLKPLTYLKVGKNSISFLIILLLWSYAFLTGLSPSVLRSVTMFSLITIALYGKRITNTYNTLFISAFLLLLINPFYIFDIGFQLSYCAVFSIISIKPLLDKLWSPKMYPIKKIWDVIGVSVAAQIGVLPLSLFYFHQFPALFLVSNIVIIPFLGFLLSIGVITMIFAYFGNIPDILFNTLDTSITYLYQFVRFIGAKENYVFEQIPFNYLNLIGFYFLIICLIMLLWKYSYQKLVFVLSSILIVQIGLIVNHKNSQYEALVIFNQYKTTLIAHKKGNKIHYGAKNMKYKQNLLNYGVNEFATFLVEDSLQNYYSFQKKTLLVVDENRIYKTNFKSDYILLTNSPKINLKRLIQIQQPQQIIIDNNNYKSYTNRWRNTCSELKIPYHFTGIDGAYIFKKEKHSFD